MSERLGGVPVAVLRHLADSDRFAARLGAAVEDWLGPLPVLRADAAAVMALDAGGLETLARRVGAVWHGRAMSQAVGGGAVRALVAAVGVELRQLGLAQGWRRPASGAALDPERISVALDRDGRACLHAWCLAQPPPVGRRVSLRLALPEPDEEQLAVGPGLVAALCAMPDAE